MSELKNKKILFVFRNFTFGGSERQAFHVAEYLKTKYDCHITFLAFSAKGKVAEICDEKGISWVSYPLNWGSSGLIKKTIKLFLLKKKIKELSPEIIIPYTHLPNIICGILWKSVNAKFCFWNQRSFNSFNEEIFFQRKAIKNIQSFVCNSKATAENLKKMLKINPEKISIIHNGVVLSDPISNRDEWRKYLGINEDVTVAVMVANIHANKDHLTLLKAWKAVVDEIERKGSVLLLLAGRFGNIKNNLDEFCQENNLTNSIRFLGEVKDISGLLVASDISVFSSNAEGSPNGLLESMAANLPCAATDIPAIREIFQEEQLNYLHTPYDYKKFAENILTLVNNPIIRKNLGEKNKLIIEKEYSLQTMTENMSHLLSEGLKKNIMNSE